MKLFFTLITLLGLVTLTPSCSESAKYEIVVEPQVSTFLADLSRHSNEFQKVLDATKKELKGKKGNALNAFVKHAKRLYPSKKLGTFFKTNAELPPNSSDEDVKSYLLTKRTEMMEETASILRVRLSNQDVAYTSIDPDFDRIVIGVNKKADKTEISKIVGGETKLEFFETINGFEFASTVVEIDKMRREEDSTQIMLSQMIHLGSSTSAHTNFSGPIRMGRGEMLAHPNDVKKIEEILKSKKYAHWHSVQFERILVTKEMFDLGDGRAKIPQILICIARENRSEMITIKDIYRANAGQDFETGEYTVDVTMTSDGEQKWRKITMRSVGKIIAISLNGELISAPLVNAPISGGKTQISGRFTLKEAAELAGQLNAGDLAVPCRFVTVKKL